MRILLLIVTLFFSMSIGKNLFSDEHTKSYFSVAAQGDLWIDDVGSENEQKNYENGLFDLIVGANLSENVAVEMYLTAGAEDIRTVPRGSGDDRWPGVAFDGVSLLWKVNEHVDLTLGDYVLHYGVPKFYRLRNSALILPETFSRGAHGVFKLGEKWTLEAGLGVLDRFSFNESSLSFKLACSKLFNLYAGANIGSDDNTSYFYGLEIFFSGLTITLAAKQNFDGISCLFFNPGIEGHYKMGENFLLDFGVLGEQNSNEEVEEAELIASSLFLDNRLNFWYYVEPGYQFNKLFSLGLNFNVPYGESEALGLNFEPRFYIDTTENTQTVFWVAYNTEENKPSLGMEFNYNF